MGDILIVIGVIVGVILIGSFCWLCYAITHAPEGWQDTTFHLGKRP
jgi:hypothetical protein